VTLPYEEDTLEGYYGWREPTYAELAQEEQDRQDRLEDRGGGMTNPRREPTPAVSSQLASVHHTQAPPQSPFDAGGLGSTSNTKETA
jgi:hypothetical protein